jgi:hypothetical protein
MYDLNPKWSVGIGFTNLQFSASATKRQVNSSTFSVRVKYNFVPSTKPFVPYLQVGYNFLNNIDLSLGQFTNTFGQRQEQFSGSTTTYLGVSFNLGAEIRLSNPFRFVVSSGLNKVNLTSDDNILSTAFYNNPSRTSNDPVNTKPPTAVNGVGFWSYTAGLKYYFGRTKKKRNF